MKLEELRPCDNCGGPVGLIFRIVRSTHAVVQTHAVRERFGLSLITGSDAVAGALSSYQDDAVKLLADQEDENGKKLGWGEAHLCPTCWVGDINIAVLMERIADRNSEAT